MNLMIPESFITFAQIIGVVFIVFVPTFVILGAMFTAYIVNKFNTKRDL